MSTTETAPILSIAGTTSASRFLVPLYPTPGAPIPLDRRLVFGRKPGRGGQVVDDNRMSRAHFELRRSTDYDVFNVRDLGSKNGTIVDRRRVKQTYLRDGAVIRAGDTIWAYVERTAPVGASQYLPTGIAVARAWAEEQADKAAAADLPVLVVGPTGAGKELLAQRLHSQSGRAGPMVALNCATLSNDLIASELFGHAKGAFSGAGSARPGLFRAASTGTLFLDEIGELPLEQQPALLRALQERKVRPVGSDREVDVDARIIAAAHRDLLSLETAGAFRADLRARLCALTIEIPGLQFRRGDILPLFRLFLGGKAQLDVDAAEMLICHTWPQNARGLKHVADRVRLFAEKVDRISAGMLPTELQTPPGSEDEVAKVELGKDGLEALLREHKGNVAKVARALGQSRQGLYRRLEAHGLNPSDFR